MTGLQYFTMGHVTLTTHFCDEIVYHL